LEKKLVFKDSIIFNLNTQVGNFEFIINTKSNQLSLSKELSEKLQKDLKKQKIKTKLVAGGGAAAILLAIFLLK
tara:strand:- start:106 stop:327 length:222 start_codon:yes stop_codon:yes gene_type:complete